MTQPHQATLLVELLTEELPPKALARLGDAFAEGIAQRLAARDLVEGELSFERYATPRRLAVTIKNVRAVAPERHVREKVLPVSVALDKDGQPTAPLAKKLAALGFPDFSVNDLERRTARPKPSSCATPRREPRSPTACKARSTKRSPSCRSRRS
jgi:glycyl-tRNA synthetase beta chain